MPVISKEQVNYLCIDEENAGQRLDNFLFTALKGVPKSHVHRIIRSGEVRVNKKRAHADSRLQTGDILRLPPIRVAEKQPAPAPVPARNFVVVFEDEALLVVDKPAGVAVHGGSGISFGVIEQLRQARPDARYLELVHRLDKDTSGLLMIAKKRSALVKLHEAIRQQQPRKAYLALCLGTWPDTVRQVDLPLFKYTGLQGEKMVRVSQDGQQARTLFRCMRRFTGGLLHQHGISALSLMEATLQTGRTHQIRVHTQAQQHPIAGDERYGDYTANKRLQKIGLKRMFLHAHRLSLRHPVSHEPLDLHAPLPDDLQQLLDDLSSGSLND